MLSANQLFGEAVKQVYEPDWSGREKFVHLLDVSFYCFEEFVKRFTGNATPMDYFCFFGYRSLTLDVLPNSFCL